MCSGANLAMILMTGILLLGWNELSRSAGAFCKGDGFTEILEQARLGGATFSNSSVGSRTEITEVCDRATILAKIPEFREEGIVTRLMSDKMVQLAPDTASMLECVFYADIYIQCVYNSSSVDRLKLHANLLSPDDYGRVRKNPIYSFSFSRSLFDKIYWPEFGVENLMKVTPGFEFSDWFNQTLDEEHDKLQTLGPLIDSPK